MKYFFILLVSPVLNAAIYNYYPETVLKMGGGYDPFRPTNAFQDCIESDGFERIDTVEDSSLSNEVFISLVKSYKDLYSFTKFSASMAANYKIFSGNMQVNFEEESMFHSDSLTWIVMFRTDFGRMTLKNPRLKQEFALLKKNELIDTCGREVVLNTKKGTISYVLLTMKNLKESHRKELEMKFKAKVSGSFWGAKMDSHFKSIVSSAYMASNTSVKIQTVGGSGIHDFSDLIKDNFIDINKIPAVVSNHLKTINFQTAAPIQYQTADIQSFTKNDFSLKKFNKKSQVEIFYMLSEVYGIEKRLFDILYGVNSNNYDLLDSRDLENNYDFYNTLRSELYSSLQSCYEDNDIKCSLPERRWPKVRWPGRSKEYCESIRRDFLSSGKMDSLGYSMSKKRDLIPIIKDDNTLSFEDC
jgi:hypothetical protein